MDEIVQKLATFIKNAAKPDKNNRQRVLFHLLSEFLQQIVIEAEASNTVTVRNHIKMLTHPIAKHLPTNAYVHSHNDPQFIRARFKNFKADA